MVCGRYSESRLQYPETDIFLAIHVLSSYLSTWSLSLMDSLRTPKWSLFRETPHMLRDACPTPLSESPLSPGPLGPLSEHPHVGSQRYSRRPSYRHYGLARSPGFVDSGLRRNDGRLSVSYGLYTPYWYQADAFATAESRRSMAWSISASSTVRGGIRRMPLGPSRPSRRPSSMAAG